MSVTYSQYREEIFAFIGGVLGIELVAKGLPLIETLNDTKAAFDFGYENALPANLSAMVVLERAFVEMLRNQRVSSRLSQEAAEELLFGEEKLPRSFENAVRRYAHLIFQLHSDNHIQLEAYRSACEKMIDALQGKFDA